MIRGRMDTKSFLEKVMPEVGNYVLHLQKSSKSRWNQNYKSIDELVDAITQIDKTPATVFFAVGSFEGNVIIDEESGKTKVLRTQDKAAWFKTLCCDLDVGGTHEYETARDAVKALWVVCDKIKLPRPMLVSSGRGVHCYWPLTKKVSASSWEMMSKLLRAALQENGLDLDASKIHDTSMVLRPAGSHHKKDPSNWRTVEVRQDQGPFEAMDLLRVLKGYKDKVDRPKTGAKKTGKTSLVMDAVLTGSPIDVESVGEKCNQIRALIESGGQTDAAGRDVEEPMWRDSMGMAAFAIDKQQAAILLSGKHSGFVLEETMSKLNNWKGTGPTNCATFKKHCPEGCAGCEHDGNITSPAQLSVGATEVTMHNPETQAPVTFNLPKRYSVKNGGVYYQPAGSDEEMMISPYMIYVLDRFTDIDNHRQTAKLLVKFPLEGEKVVDIDATCIAKGGNDLVSELLLKQVYIAGDPRPLRAYLMTYLAELQKTKPIEMYYRHFGWQSDNVFLGSTGPMGEVDKEAHPHYDGPIKDYTSTVCQNGTANGWVRLTRLFAQPGATYHGLVFLMMAGAPLMRGSGLASTLVNSYSKESGSGKTITARIGLSIWGQPSKLMRTVNDTDNALYKHFGIMNSLGAYIDEITTMDPERLRAFAFTLQEGRERDRVRQSADGFREKVHWCMPLFASSNRDAYDVIGMRYSSEAEKLRILQFPFNKLAIFEQKGTNLGYEITHFLEQNYGHIGPVIVNEIMKRGGAAKVFNDAYRRFHDRYDFSFTGPERFYQAMMVIADAMGEIMESLDLIEFDYQESVRNGLQHIEELRVTHHDGAMNGLDIIFQYLTEHADKIVHYRESQDAQGKGRAYTLEPPKTAVARTEVKLKGDAFEAGSIFINRQSFKKWCGYNGVEYNAVLNDMKKEGVRVVGQIRKTLFKGVPGATVSGQTYCFSLDMSSHPRFIEANAPAIAGSIDAAPKLAAVES